MIHRRRCSICKQDQGRYGRRHKWEGFLICDDCKSDILAGRRGRGLGFDPMAGLAAALAVLTMPGRDKKDRSGANVPAQV